MEVIIDRFEDNYAIVEIEEGQFEKISKVLLPNAKENDIVSISVDHNKTEKRKKYIEKLMDQAFED